MGRRQVERPAGRGRPRFAEEWLVAVLDSLSEGVIALDADGHVVAANPAAERLLGFEIAERRYDDWDALSWRDLLDEQQLPIHAHLHPVAATLRDRRPRGPDVVALTRSDGVRWLSLATHLLAGSQSETRGGAVVSFQDVTERVRAEHELKRLVDLLRDFIATTSHELRTPLATILGFSEILSSDWDVLPEQERRSAAESILRQGQHLHRQVEDLLVVASLEGGGIEPRTQTVAVSELVELALDSVTTPPELRADVPDDLCVLVDPDHGRRIVVNLIENATRYGAPPFEISATADGERVELAVADQGPGVPEAFVPHVFERFRRASIDSPGATGLGLAIVAGLAGLNGGEVRYERNRPRGARFVVSLPAAAPGSAATG